MVLFEVKQLAQWFFLPLKWIWSWLTRNVKRKERLKIAVSDFLYCLSPAYSCSLVEMLRAHSLNFEKAMILSEWLNFFSYRVDRALGKKELRNLIRELSEIIRFTRSEFEKFLKSVENKNQFKMEEAYPLFKEKYGRVLREIEDLSRELGMEITLPPLPEI